MKQLKSHIVGAIFGLSVTTAHLALGGSVNIQCDISRGFTFAADSQNTIGYITSLAIGSSTLGPDFSVKDPTNGASIQVVAVLSQVSWAGGQSDSISFTGQVSTANKQKLALLLHQPLNNTQVQIGFKVFAYDPVARKYYKSFFPATDAILKGLIAGSGSAPQLTVSSSPGSEAQSPTNFQMSVGIAPQSISQTIQYAVGAGTQVAKPWGIGAK